jgi:hypothetical protein
MKLVITDNWAVRSAICALFSALSLKYLDNAGAFYWGPGVVFALTVAMGRSHKVDLLVAVALSYTLGYLGGQGLDKLGTGEWVQRIGMVAVGSGLLAWSLAWKGGLSKLAATRLFVLGTAMAWPFWWILDAKTEMNELLHWTLMFAVWQMPVAWFYLKASRK